MIDFDLAEAFYIEYDVDPKHRDPFYKETLRLRVPFNCYGDPIEADSAKGRFSNWLADETPGAEKYYPDFVCFILYGPAKSPGTIHDIRTLDMLLAGCCPIELTGSQLGGLESED